MTRGSRTSGAPRGRKDLVTPFASPRGSFEAATVGWSGTGNLSHDLQRERAVIRGWLRSLSRGYCSARGIFYKNAHSEGSRHSLFTAARICRCTLRARIYLSSTSTAIPLLSCRGPECVMFARLVCDERVSARHEKVTGGDFARVKQSGKWILFRTRDGRAKLSAAVNAIGHAF